MRSVTFLLVSSFCLALTTGLSQSVGIGTNSPDASALLDLKSNNKGILVPRTSTISRLAILSPAKGLMLYDTTTSSFWFHNGAAWAQVSAAANGWNLSGNTGTNPANNFVGTTDNLPLRFKTNNNWSGELNPITGNVYLGYKAAEQQTTGYSNVAIGSAALRLNIYQSNLVAIGDSALYNSGITASAFLAVGNIGIGSKALYSNTTGAYNTATGYNALFKNTTGDYNTAFGTSALYENTTGYENTATGYKSLNQNTIGSFNTAAGYYALNNNINGSNNTAHGHQALFYNTTASNNTAIGSNTLEFQSYDNGGTPYESNNVAIGYEALYKNDPSSTSNGISNTAVGSYALRNNTIGLDNTAIGTSALYYNNNGYENTAVGRQALYSNTAGYFNTATGCKALRFNEDGDYNTAFGSYTLYSNTQGQSNTSIGAYALYNNTSGTANTANGYNALYFNTSGTTNTAIGHSALFNIGGGGGNIAIGYDSGTDGSVPNANNTISIGNAGYYNGASNQAFIGNLSTAWTGGNTTWFTYASDARVKNNVSEDVKGLEFISRLRPVTYNLDIRTMRIITGNKETEDFAGKYDVEKIKQSGFLAQEVEQAAKESGYNFNGITIPKRENELYTMSYSLFVVPLVKAVQEQQMIIVDLQKQIAEMKNEIELLKNKK